MYTVLIAIIITLATLFLLYYLVIWLVPLLITTDLDKDYDTIIKIMIAAQNSANHHYETLTAMLTLADHMSRWHKYAQRF